MRPGLSSLELFFSVFWMCEMVGHIKTGEFMGG